MLRNYFIIAFRNLVRNKVYSFINIFGLSLGIACCLLLALFLADEIRYDRHHNRLDDFYRVVTHFESERGLDRLATTSPPIAMALWEEIPEIESATRILNPPGVSHNLIRYGDNMFYESNGFVGDSTFFDLFNYTITEGNPKTALVEAQSVVLADHLAKKLFGDEPALDKTIHINQGGPSGDFRVTAVYRSEEHSHIRPNFIISMTSSGWGAYIRTDPNASNEWAGNNFVPAFVRLVPGHDVALVEKKMNDVLMKHGAEAMKAMGVKKSLHLQPVKDFYLKSDIGRSPRINYLYIIGAIGLFILLIACINFMNLSTAKAGKRATEIGIRKVMGAVRHSLIQQVFGEAIVIVLIAVLISIGIVQGALPFFNSLTERHIQLDSNSLVFLASSLLALATITGLLAGSYPAFYLSSFQPAQVLKGKANLTASGTLRQILVVFQFIIAIALGCGMLIIGDQLRFMQEQDLGFESGARIALPLRSRTAREAYPALYQELSRNPQVAAVSAADYMPGNMIWSDMMFYPDGGSMETAVLYRRNPVDFGYQSLLGIPLIAGRPFSENRAENQNKIIINRTAVKKLGLTPEEMLGRMLHFDWHEKKYSYEVIGVMEDYHQLSLKEEIFPTIFEVPEEPTRYENVVVHVKTSDMSGLLAELEKVWKARVNDTPFEYHFLDEAVQKQYEEDRRVASIITTFTFIAMIICCLGLYGLSSFMAERRFKEIGIRKVMGASLGQIAGMMSKEFVKLVIIAFVIAAPVTAYLMSRWLEGFAYHVAINVWVFVLAGLASLFIALATVSFESLKAASANPVNSLRNE